MRDSEKAGRIIQTGQMVPNIAAVASEPLYRGQPDIYFRNESSMDGNEPSSSVLFIDARTDYSER